MDYEETEINRYSDSDYETVAGTWTGILKKNITVGLLWNICYPREEQVTKRIGGGKGNSFKSKIFCRDSQIGELALQRWGLQGTQYMRSTAEDFSQFTHTVQEFKINI